MLEGFKAFFNKHAAPVPEKPDDRHRLQVAACSLLLEVAHADDTFTADERAHIEEVLMRHFELDGATAQELMALAETERREATDLFRFTSLINQHYDEGQRMVLAELIWRVVYADGTLSKHEGIIARKLANLLELRPGYLAEARNRAIGKR